MADYTPERYEDDKIKKKDGDLSIPLGGDQHPLPRQVVGQGGLAQNVLEQDLRLRELARPHRPTAPPPFVEVVDVVSAQDMYEAVAARQEWADFIFKAAAVADYTPERYEDAVWRRMCWSRTSGSGSLPAPTAPQANRPEAGAITSQP